jgi:HEAT repeat protein
MGVAARPKILDILLASCDPAADEALIAAAPELEPAMQRQAVHVLLSRGRENGLELLPAIYDRLEDEAKDQIVAQSARLFAALRTTIRSSNIKTRLNTVEIVRRSGNLRLAYLPAHATHDGAPQVRTEAAIALRDLANRHCQTYADTTAALREVAEADAGIVQSAAATLKMLQDERRYLIDALAEAINCYESHFRPEVLEAAMLLAHELEARLFTQSTAKRGKLAHTMMEIFAASRSPKFAPFVYVALCYQELRRQIVPFLTGCSDAEFLAQLIRHHWLARDPSIRKQLAAIRSLPWLENNMDSAFALPPDAAAMTPSWLLALGLPSGQKVSVLLNLLLPDNRAANRAAVWGLIGIDTPSSTLALQTALDHQDEEVRKAAEREIAFRSRRDNLIVRRPRKDRPDEWANLLDRANLSEEFDDLWQHFERLHPIHAQSAGPHAVAYVPGFTTQLQVKLRSPQASDRLRALRLLQTLNSGERFKNDVFNSANDGSSAIRAAAMGVLGRVADVTSRRILERGLNDEDASVQAAAIDALDEMDAPRRIELCLPKTDSDHAEVRAAAVRTLLKLRVPKAAVALLGMLRDPRADHRCCALWIIDQLRLDYLTPRVLELAAAEGDPRIARIADHVGRRLQRARQSSASTPQARSSASAPQAQSSAPAAPRQTVSVENRPA